MFNQYRLKEVLAEYKQNFVSKQWGEEKYKWEAVKWFQDNWDVKAPDFAEMLSRSLDRTFNLLASVNNFPKGMIVGFAKAVNGFKCLRKEIRSESCFVRYGTSDILRNIAVISFFRIIWHGKIPSPFKMAPSFRCRNPARAETIRGSMGSGAADSYSR